MKKLFVIFIIALMVISSVSLWAGENTAVADPSKIESTDKDKADVEMEEPSTPQVDKVFAAYALVGANFSTLAGSVAKNYDYNTGFKFGGGIEYMLLNGFFVNAGIEFLFAQGGIFNYENAISVGNKKTEGIQYLYYVSIPILLKLKASNGLFFAAGPYFSFLLSAKKDVSVQVNGLSTTPEAVGEANGGNADDFKSIDIGGKIGLGYSVGIGNGNKVTIGLYYQQGFTYINEISKGDMLNRSFMADVALFLF